MKVGDRGINITLEGVSNIVLEFAEQVEKLEKRNEELELLSDKLLEENETLKSELDEATNEILRQEQKISDLECIGIDADETNDDHELY